MEGILMGSQLHCESVESALFGMQLVQKSIHLPIAWLQPKELEQWQRRPMIELKHSKYIHLESK